MPNKPGQENEMENIISGTIQKKLYDKKSAGFTLHEAILPVFQEVLDFSESIIQSLEENGQSPEVACRSGCSYCCHSQVSIIPVEALLISAFIKHDFTGSEIHDLNTGISRVKRLTTGRTLEQRYALKKELPCLFLKNGKCTIYRIRPSICRSWNSFNSNVCKTAYESEDHESSITGSPARNYVYGTTRGLFQQLSEALSLQSDVLLLHNAMFDCLTHTDPVGQWSRGNNVFNYKFSGQ